MIYNNREYPHPVLGIGESVKGRFEVDLSVRLGKDHVIIEPIFRIENEDIEKLIETKDAIYTIQVYCRSTMFREIFKREIKYPEHIAIKTEQLRDKVEVDFLVCANRFISEYVNKAQHPDYGGSNFVIERGDLLAYGGKGIFHATKTPEKLRAISSLMNIDQYEKENGPVYNFYDGEKITVRLPKNDYILYRGIAQNSHIAPILHSSVVLPALMDAIGVIKSGDSEFSDKSWFKILKGMIDDTNEDSTLLIGQKILDNPVNRAFTTIQKLIEYEE